MNENLALDTISKLMEWDRTSSDREEFALLKLMAQFKYDNYEGYEPGSRFFSSLIGWLRQFNDVADRRIAYEFLKKYLIFFSRQDLIHLVHRLKPAIQRTIIQSVAKDKGIPHWDVPSKERLAFDIRLRQCLFVGLSDGAKMDIFRRDNEGRISNEQTLLAYDVSIEKWCDLIKELKKDIVKNKWEAKPVFKHIYLIDDFTASGTTLIYYDTESKEWKGKVKKFMLALKSAREEMLKKHSEEILDELCHIHIHHYVGTAFSQTEVQKRVNDYRAYLDQVYSESPGTPKFEFTVSFGIVLDKSIKITQETHPDFYNLITNHYDDSVQTETTKCVKYGYKQGALPLVLEHNTPNNSVGIIWAETSDANIPNTSTPMAPLFRRRTRHS